MKLAELEELFWTSVRSEAPPGGLERVFRSTPALGAVRRMRIYHSAYWARQQRTLGETFPQVRRAAGEARFRELAREYLTLHPSESAAIERIGERFAGFLAERRATLPGVVPGLAELEWARVDVLLAPEAQAVAGRASLAGRDLSRCRAVFGPHVRVLRLPRGALRYWTGDDPSDSGNFETRVLTVVFRRSHKVHHGPFSEPEGTAIELAAQGASFAEVCALLSEVWPAERIASAIAGWLDREWLERLEEDP